MSIAEAATAIPDVPGWYRAFKRLFDVTVAMGMTMALGPVLLMVIIAILIEDGRPIFFFQERIGQGMRRIRLCKFRSMHANSDETIHRIHVEQTFNGSAMLRLQADPRVTRVGRIIRKWSIDELPNLWNVIRGDMSLVGPRPLVPYEAANISGQAAARFEVLPGITGLAQVSDRLDMSHEERLALDTAYVEGRSVRFDISILARTPKSMVRSKG